MRNFSLDLPLSRSQVHLTSLAVNGLPSCHLTPSRSGNVRSVPSSFHDQPVARSGTIAVVDNADWAAVDNILLMKNVTPQMYTPEEFQRIRNHQANGMGGLPLVGDPDSVARDMARLAALGLKGIAVSFVNFLDELPYFCAEVLPRLAGLRDNHAT